MNYTKAYLIYCEDNKNVAENISEDLKRTGIEFTHDTFDLSEHAYIRKQYLNSSAPIFLLVSDNFLKSENCMQNILELVEDSRLKGRIKPIILEGRQRIQGTNQYESVPTKFERLGDVVNYINYWSTQYQTIRTEMRHATDDRIAALEPKLHFVQEISTNILGDFMRYLRGSSYIAYKHLENNNFRQLFDEFGGRGATLLNEYRSLPPYYPIQEEIEEETEEDVEEEKKASALDYFDYGNYSNDQLSEPIEDAVENEVEETLEEVNISDIPGLNLLSVVETSEDEVENIQKEILEGEPHRDDQFAVEIPEDFLENFILEDEPEDFIEDEIINDLFGEMNDFEQEDAKNEHPENNLQDLIDELADDILEESSIVNDENESEEKGEATEDLENLTDHLTEEIPESEEGEAHEDLEGLIDELAEDILEEDDFGENEMSDNAPILQGESPEELGTINDLLDEIANDLVEETNETPTELDEIEIRGEEAKDDTLQLFQDEALEKSTMDIAEELAASGDIKGASGLYRQLIENDPKDVDLRYAFAMMLMESNSDITLAKKQLLVAHDLENEDEDILFALGAISESEGDYNAAKSYYERVILLDLEHEQAYYRLGSLLANCFENQDFVASSYLQRAISLDDEYSEAYFEYAKLLNSYFGKSKKAAKYFKKALKHDRHFAEAHLELANIFIIHHKQDKALYHYEAAIAINKRFQTAENDEKYGVQEEEAISAAISAMEQKAGSQKTVLITGATSGIGQAAAQIFAQNGYRIIITGRRKERLSALQAILEAEFHVEVLALSFDVREQKAVEDAINGLPDDWENIDILVNNAGLAKGFAPINEGQLWHWETMIDTNVKGLLYMTRAVSPLMVARKTGYIINIGSIAGKETYLNGNVYCATKAAVDVLTRGMRMDLHQHNIRVTGIHPGHVETEFALVRFDGDKERAKIYEDFQPLTAADVADTIYYVASRPPHVNVEDVVMWSTQQASATLIDRSGRDNG
jgi:NADP-dependent 3-hydroxy acid dehydrogenase YdfG/Tfp pilus assembly protein PilF